jgi:hypothetical protein
MNDHRVYDRRMLLPVQLSLRDTGVRAIANSWERQTAGCLQAGRWGTGLALPPFACRPRAASTHYR